MLQITIIVKHTVDEVCNTLTDLLRNGFADRSWTKNTQNIGRNVRERYMGSKMNDFTAATIRLR